MNKKFIFTISMLTIMLSALGAGSIALAQIENELNLTNSDSQIKDLAGVNSLMSAVANNDSEGVKFFAKAGSKTINEKNIGGGTALLIACRNGNFEIAKILIDGGADVNISDNEGYTPLMRAANAKNSDIVSLLINNKANIYLTNGNEETAMIHATMSGCDICVAQILLAAKSSKKTNNDFLLKQLMLSFSIAQNKQNNNTKFLLQKYLDEMIKMTSEGAEMKDSIIIDSANNDDGSAKQEFINKDKGLKYIFKKKDDIAVVVAPKVDKPKTQKLQIQQNKPLVAQSQKNKEPVKFKFITGPAAQELKAAKE